MLKHALRRFGYVLGPAWKGDDPAEALGLQLRRRKVALVVDVGAQFGGSIAALRALGHRGPIICVEPNPACLPRLRQAAASDGGVTVLACAGGAAPGEAVLNAVGDGDGLSSLHPLSALAQARFSTAAGAVTRVAVPVRTVADILDEAGVAPDAPVTLLTDAQGHDAAVLRGAGPRMAQVVAFRSELAARALYDGAGTHWDVLDFARSHGFEPVSFATVSRDRDGMLIEYDALFARP